MFTVIIVQSSESPGRASDGSTSPENDSVDVERDSERRPAKHDREKLPMNDPGTTTERKGSTTVQAPLRPRVEARGGDGRLAGHERRSAPELRSPEHRAEPHLFPRSLPLRTRSAAEQRDPAPARGRKCNDGRPREKSRALLT